MYYLLHISDLHRSTTEPFNNDAVLAALLQDHERYRIETPSVPRIDAIIVSGDIIQGMTLQQRGTDASVWKAELANQYGVASDLLGRLADRFLDGDRSRLVIAPGNHDVCWNTAFKAMEPVATDSLKDGVLKALSMPSSPYRWSWKDLTAHKIVDQSAYARRLDSYWDFVEHFYSGTTLVRAIDRTIGYNLFELDEGRILVAAFDSVSGNDCFAFSGDFATDAVARCAMELRDLNRVHDLRIAVWHHSIDGPPARQDYMDVARIQEMIGYGFRLGLHGHQHVAAAAAHYIHLPESEAMAVISAGSLCAGARELPRGVDRQYNIITLDEKRSSAQLMVRQLAEGGHFARKTDGRFAAEGSISLSWQRPLDQGGRPQDTDSLRLRKAVEEAEKLRATGANKEALAALRTLNFDPGTYQRALALSLALECDDVEAVISIIGNPVNIEELIQLVISSIRHGDVERAENELGSDLAKSLPPPMRAELEGRIQTFKALKS